MDAAKTQWSAVHRDKSPRVASQYQEGAIEFVPPSDGIDYLQSPIIVTSDGSDGKTETLYIFYLLCMYDQEYFILLKSSFTSVTHTCIHGLFRQPLNPPPS